VIHGERVTYITQCLISTMIEKYLETLTAGVVSCNMQWRIEIAIDRINIGMSSKKEFDALMLMILGSSMKYRMVSVLDGVDVGSSIE